MSEVFYCGERAGQVMVRRGEMKHPLDPRFDLRKHSPNGFRWGRGEGGPEQLSLALLADALQNEVRALQLHQRFNERVVRILPERWTLTRSRILAYASMLEQEG